MVKQVPKTELDIVGKAFQQYVRDHMRMLERYFTFEGFKVQVTSGSKDEAQVKFIHRDDFDMWSAGLMDENDVRQVTYRVKVTRVRKKA